MKARNTKVESRAGDGRWSLAFRAGAGCSTLMFIMAMATGGCGASSQSASALGGESHFLTSCDATCGDGLECIARVCTRPCARGDVDACEGLRNAECRAEVEVLDVSGVCDVKCEVDGECQALSSSHHCVSGVCRAPAIIGANVGAAGASGAGSLGAGGETTSGTDGTCAAFRDQAGTADTVVMVRNELSIPVYLQPPRSCGDAPTRLVAFDRPVLFPEAREVCGVMWCQQLQDNGYVAPSPCSEDCASPELVRLEPGAELSAGRFRSEERAHGSAASGLPRMPDACFSGRDPQLTPGAECSSEVPMAGAYAVTAKAFTTLECGVDAGVCDCVSGEEGSCVTGVSSASGEASAAATFNAGVARVDLVFR